MHSFESIIERYEQNGNKTGWWFIPPPQEIAAHLQPENRKAFRVPGMIDAQPVEQLAAQPKLEGDYLIALNAPLRRKLKKDVGDLVRLQFEKDTAEMKIPEMLLTALQSEPEALAEWDKLALSHQRYYVNHLNAAKTLETKTTRIAQTLEALAKGWDFGQMIRAAKAARQ